MRTHRKLGYTLPVAALLLFALLAFAAKEFVPPPVNHARSYSARDEHPGEKVTIAIDLYDDPEKASLFKVNWKEHGYLPVQFIVSNDGDHPVELAGMKVQLITANRTKLLPATDDDLYRRISKVRRRGDEPGRNPLPVPLPRRGPSTGAGKDARQEIEARFQARAVEPHTTLGGFLFFDIQGLRNPLAGAHLYVTGVRDAEGNELMFFDILLER